MAIVRIFLAVSVSLFPRMAALTVCSLTPSSLAISFPVPFFVCSCFVISFYYFCPVL